MAAQKIRVFNPNGFNGRKIEEWGDFAADRRIVGKPRESGYNFYTDSTRQLIAGLWICTPGTVRIENFPTDEFCILLEGTVVITDTDGHVVNLGPGDGFIIPKGFNGTWEMRVTVKKYYVIFEDLMSPKLEALKAKFNARSAPAAKKAAKPAARKTVARRKTTRRRAA
jgi:uncharacterized cupin superfamily protein